MSENKRNRKSNQNKEPRRPIILAKKSDRDDRSVPEKPRILLKTRDKDTSEPSRSTTTPTQISIASRPIDAAGSSNVDPTKVQKSQSLSTSTSREAKDSSGPPASIEPTATIEKVLQSMKNPISIISDHYQIQNHVQDYIIETNTDFVVIGIIGTQGSGKSFILNMLIDDAVEIDDNDKVNKLLKGRTGIFTMRNQSKDPLSNMPSTEGIQMYITRHRTIFLDCSPLLCNPYKKEAIFNELDDLKMLIFLLTVCNSLILVEDNGFNMHLMRLLLSAESMKIDVYENDLNERRHSPNILIFKNKCRNRDFTIEAKQRTSHLYRGFFECSGSKMIRSSKSLDDKLNGLMNDDDSSLTVFHFPWIDMEKKPHYQAHPDIDLLVAEFRQRVFMAPRTSFPLPNQQTTTFTEKNWFHLALAVWESHKTSYFLRKYETLKEKEWALRV